MEYSVSPFFIENAFGGNPNPNSSTLIPNFLATKKCPNSWMRTNTESMSRKSKAVNIDYIISNKQISSESTNKYQ